MREQLGNVGRGDYSEDQACTFHLRQTDQADLPEQRNDSAGK